MDVISGIAVGSVVGLLLGLSASPVVSATVGALLALAVTFLGLGASVGPVAVSPASSRKLLAFCAGLVVFLAVGVEARTFEVLGPSPQAQVQVWTHAGFTPQQARSLVVYQRLGILPAGATKTDAKATPTNPLLFASEDSANCGLLQQDRFQNPRDRLKAMVDLGPPWSALGPVARSMSDQQIADLTQAAWRIACER